MQHCKFWRATHFTIIVVKPSDFPNMCNQDWVRVVLSPMIDDLAMACPLCQVMDTCNPTIGCSKHPSPPSSLSCLGMLGT